jgi:hypothetical protein
VHLDIQEMTTAPQIAALHEKTIDIGLLREPPPATKQTSASRRYSANPSWPYCRLPTPWPPANRAARTVGRLTLRAPAPRGRPATLRLDHQPVYHSRLHTPGSPARGGVADRVCPRGYRSGHIPAPASIRRIRLKGVAFRRIEPSTARTRVAVAWRKNDQNPLVTNLLATVSQDPPDRPRGQRPRV